MSGRTELRGEKVLVRETRREDLEPLLAMWNDGRVMQWVKLPEGLGWDMERMLRWFENLDEAPHRAHFVIEADELGFCGELHYRRVEDTGIYSLDVKLRPEAQGRGLAREAFALLIDQVFAAEPACQAVYTEPWPENEAARKLYAACGLEPRERPEILGEGPSYWERRRGTVAPPGTGC